MISSHQPLRIILIDNNESVLIYLKMILEKEDPIIIPISDATSALTIIEKERPNLIITDIQLPGISGLTLLKEVKRKWPSLPVIIMTGFTDIFETQKAANLGADGFLPKPFNSNEVFQILQNVKDKTNHNSFQNSHLKPIETLNIQFKAIPIEEFLNGKKIIYGIYLKISNDHYIKLSHSGEDLEIDKIENLLKKEVQYLYLLKRDYLKFVKFPIENLIYGDSDDLLFHEKKILINKVSQLYEQIFKEIKLNHPNSIRIKKIMFSTLELLCEDTHLFKLLSAIFSLPKIHQKRLIITITISALLYSKKKNDYSELHFFFYCSFLHDVGLTKISKSTLEQNNLNDPLIRREYEMHCFYGYDLLKEIQSFPEEIAKIALEHHENKDGSGYPQNLSSNETTEISKIIHFTDLFSAFYLKNDFLKPKLTLSDPLEQTLQELESVGSKIDKNDFLDLQNLFLNEQKTC